MNVQEENPCVQEDKTYNKKAVSSCDKEDDDRTVRLFLYHGLGSTGVASDEQGDDGAKRTWTYSNEDMRIDQLKQRRHHHPCWQTFTG